MNKSSDTGHIKSCQICQSPIEIVFSLGHQPVTQQYLDSKTVYEPETFYPLNLCRCNKCGLIQLDHIVDPKIVFAPTYPYRTGMTNMLINNFKNLAETIHKLHGIKKDDLVVDLGSNDGSLLKPFKAKGAKVVGIEPTNAAKDANRAGIPTFQNFIAPSVSKKIVKKFGKAKYVTCTNAFAHINKIGSLVPSIKILMDRNSVFVSESQYIMDILEKNEFDTIYHEHLRFYSLKPLSKLFEKFGMTLFDAERITAAGGSIRAYAKIGKCKQSQRLMNLIKDEERAGVYSGETYAKFASKNIEAKNNLLSLLLSIKKQGHTIVGLTSSARSNTLLGFAKIDNTILDYLVEKDGSPKIGLLTPGSHIKIVGEKVLFKNQPPYLVVLSWHIGDELIKKMRSLGFKGKYIIPLPQPKIID